MAKAVKKAEKPRSAGWTGVYEALRHDILSLALPPGELLDEMSLSRRFGFSPSEFQFFRARFVVDHGNPYDALRLTPQGFFV